MSAAEWVAFGVAGVAVMVTMAVLLSLRGVRRSVVRLQATVEALGVEASIDDLGAAVADLGARVEQIARATGVPEPPRPVRSRVPTMFRSRSVVKAMAFGSGTAHVARRLRNGNGTSKETE